MGSAEGRPGDALRSVMSCGNECESRTRYKHAILVSINDCTPVIQKAIAMFGSARDIVPRITQLEFCRLFLGPGETRGRSRCLGPPDLIAARRLTHQLVSIAREPSLTSAEAGATVITSRWCVTGTALSRARVGTVVLCGYVGAAIPVFTGTILCAYMLCRRLLAVWVLFNAWWGERRSYRLVSAAPGTKNHAVLFTARPALLSLLAGTVKQGTPRGQKFGEGKLECLVYTGATKPISNRTVRGSAGSPGDKARCVLPREAHFNFPQTPTIREAVTSVSHQQLRATMSPAPNSGAATKPEVFAGWLDIRDDSRGEQASLVETKNHGHSLLSDGKISPGEKPGERVQAPPAELDVGAGAAREFLREDGSNEWEVGVGDLIIDLDADLEKDRQRAEEEKIMVPPSPQKVANNKSPAAGKDLKMKGSSDVGGGSGCGSGNSGNDGQDGNDKNRKKDDKPSSSKGKSSTSERSEKKKDNDKSGESGSSAKTKGKKNKAEKAEKQSGSSSHSAKASGAQVMPPPSLLAVHAPTPAPSVRHIGVNTSEVGVVTEPECLGPCEPGTSVNLEGIVWHETEGGVLVVNVTWRNKTYVGTLLDCTRHDWAPP
ncbi:hypothetical protein Bbelb_264700, partial [Branchiostoma belcheri]